MSENKLGARFSKKLEDLFIMFVNEDDYRGDTKQRESAGEKVIEVLGEKYKGDTALVIEDYAFYSEEQGFMYGFCYAAALFADGKAAGI